MRSYNYVVVPTHDFDHVEYRIRAIDFDQQCYEGKLKVYQPQFFKENAEMVKMISNKLDLSSVLQYQKEERSILAKRLINTHKRTEHLLECMCKDEISSKENILNLRTELYKYTFSSKFRKSNTMGDILKSGFDFVTRNYLHHKEESGY